MRVFVVGGSGLVGQNTVTYCRSADIAVRGTYHSTETDTADVFLDKTDADRTATLIEEYDPEIVIDTAAMHAVDDCESQRETAWRINVTGTRNVAAAADAVDAHFVFFSADYVFPGRPEETPYTEADPVAPLNYYAKTKYAGEQTAKIADDTTILRGSVIYGLTSDNFATWVLGELRAGNEIDIVDDQVSTPTYAPDIAKAAMMAAQNDLTGLYHATGPASLSRYEFTTRLADVFGFKTDLISPISTAELGQTAPRPVDGTLDSTVLYEELNYRFDIPATAFERMRDECQR